MHSDKTMSYFDIIFMILFAWSGYNGFRQGFIKSLASLAALLLGIWGAVKFSGLTCNLLAEHFESSAQYLPLIGFAVTFILIIIAVHMLAGVLDKMVSSIALGFVNKLLGIAFGILKVAFIVSIILVIINNINKNYQILPEKQVEKSFLYIPLSNFAPTIFPYLNFDKIKGNIDFEIKNPDEEEDSEDNKDKETKKVNV